MVVCAIFNLKGLGGKHRIYWSIEHMCFCFKSQLGSHLGVARLAEDKISLPYLVLAELHAAWFLAIFQLKQSNA